jgi:ATP-dependent RNA helicase RhlE
MKIIQIKLPKKEERGASFHEKSAKNSKVNVRKSRKDEMQKQILIKNRRFSRPFFPSTPTFIPKSPPPHG